MVRVLFSAAAEDWRAYAPHLRRACAARGLEAEFVTATDPTEAIDYIVYSPKGGLADFAPFKRLKAVLSLWAGVERIAGNATLRVPLCKMVDPGLTEGMREWVAGHVLRYHLGIDGHVAGQDGIWRNDVVPPLARERSVGVLGLGSLGEAVAGTLCGLGFRVCGWSRRRKNHKGFKSFSGEHGLAETLSRSEILVLLLPATPGTDSLLDAERIAMLPAGARLLNPARGTLIDDAALLAALESGHVSHATLDVFREEPLPAGHPYWTHPRVTVTPHIAAETRPATASEVVAENIRRSEAGLPLLHLVDRESGY